MRKPLCIDLFAGLGGFTEGFLAEGYDCVGFDIERHVYGDKQYPAQLVLQDVLTLHGSQFKDAACIVCSPPCQEFSYMAMPWSLAKAKAAKLRECAECRVKLTALFDACFRIQREAIEATGRDCPACYGEGKRHGRGNCPRCSGTSWLTRYIPLIVENVRGAQPWVGRAPWNYGSFYLWGDVPALMPFTRGARKKNPDGTNHGQGSWFAIADSKERGSGRKVPMNFHEHEKTGKPGRSFQSVAVEAMNDGNGRNDAGNVPHGGLDSALVGANDAGRAQKASGVLSRDSFGWSKSTPLRDCNSKSPRRKAASAEIAKIPFELSSHLARCFKPESL